MDERLIGMWIRTGSDRGLLSCRFDADGRYAFAIAVDGKLAGQERGSFRSATRPSDLADATDVVALLLRTEAGDECPLIVRFVDGDMLLDGQRWRRIATNAERPGFYAASTNMVALIRANKNPDADEDVENPIIRGAWSPTTLWAVKQQRQRNKKS